MTDKKLNRLNELNQLNEVRGVGREAPSVQVPSSRSIEIPSIKFQSHSKAECGAWVVRALEEDTAVLSRAASGPVKANQCCQTTQSELVRVSQSWSRLVRPRIKVNQGKSKWIKAEEDGRGGVRGPRVWCAEVWKGDEKFDQIWPSLTKLNQYVFVFFSGGDFGVFFENLRAWG
jgi:hypothetical protein